MNKVLANKVVLSKVVISKSMTKNIYLYFALTSTALFLSACAADTVKTERTLETAQVSVGNIEKIITASGKVVPRVEVMIGSQVSGRIDEVLVDYNSLVEKGDVLAIIDPTTFESRISQNQNRIAAALANIKVRTLSIDRAQVSLKNAERQFTRRQDLFAKEATSKAQLEIAERDLEFARSDLELAKARLVSDKADVRQIRAQLVELQTDLARTIIRSPIKGIVIDRKVDPGQTVQASFSAPELFAIAADLSQIDVEVAIAESDVAGLDTGDKARFSVDAYPGNSVRGIVHQLRYKPKEDKNIVTYTAIVRAANLDGRLLPGMSVNLHIVTDMKSGVKLIPVAAQKFRPSPKDIAMLTAKDGPEGGAGFLLEPTLARLRDTGISETRIQAFKIKAETKTQTLRDKITGPKKAFGNENIKPRFNEMMDDLVKDILSAEEQAKYAAQISLERKIRPVQLWVASGDGKMTRKIIKLGLSDGSFVEVVSGLSDDEQVVIGITDRPPHSPKP